jgi:putative membrane protein
MDSPAPAPAPIPVGHRFEVKPTADSHFAWIRTRLAIERTLMAWVRTSTALIGFGFTIVQFFGRLRSTQDVAPALLPETPRYLGLSLIGCGILGLAVSIRQYRKLLNYMKEGFAPVAGVDEVASGTPLNSIAIVLLLIGVFAFSAVFLRIA